MPEHVLRKGEPQKHLTKPCVKKKAIGHVLPRREPQKHMTKPCVERKAIGHVLPRREPQKHLRLSTCLCHRAGGHTAGRIRPVEFATGNRYT